jgi:hypothetical protein
MPQVRYTVTRSSEGFIVGRGSKPLSAHLRRSDAQQVAELLVSAAKARGEDAVLATLTLVKPQVN